jgi:ankyrin repeat protein
MGGLRCTGLRLAKMWILRKSSLSMALTRQPRTRTGYVQVDLAHFLVEHGAEATAQDKRGSTPLHWVVFNDHLDLARILVEHVADSTVPEKKGFTPAALDIAPRSC